MRDNAAPSKKMSTHGFCFKQQISPPQNYLRRLDTIVKCLKKAGGAAAAGQKANWAAKR